MLQDIDGAIMMFHKLHLMTEREERYLFNFCSVFVAVGFKKLLLLCMPLGEKHSPRAKTCILQKSQNDIHKNKVHQSMLPTRCKKFHP